jgi:hypothetical protein
MTLRTEEEAMRSRCCGAEDCGNSQNGGPRMCLASACMAWRWQPLMVDAAYLLALEKATTEFRKAGRQYAAVHVNENRAKYGLKERPDTGYCGIGGIPQSATPIK